jgi:predicted alternative tryptophan synthase beta-subunit
MKQEVHSDKAKKPQLSRETKRGKTGPGGLGSALSKLFANFGLDCEIAEVRGSSIREPFRRRIAGPALIRKGQPTRAAATE